MKHHTFWMNIALDEAAQASQKEEIPVGAALINTDKQELVFKGHNHVEEWQDPTAHAEMLAIQSGCHSLKTNYLEHCTLYVTLEPCPMCAQAISFARIGKLVWGAYNPKGGGIDHGAQIFQKSSCFHTPQIIGGVSEQACSAFLKDFFRNKRD
jgi:tRNA(Arg) A34 adenosine deaminase TadA